MTRALVSLVAATLSVLASVTVDAQDDTVVRGSGRTQGVPSTGCTTRP